MDQKNNDVKNILFLNPIPSEMRDYSRITDREIRPNAENISSVLLKLCSDKAIKKTILAIEFSEFKKRRHQMRLLGNIMERNLIKRI